MPGILPMKVIKVGASSQSRIAQACDRCRSKKIRCDGIRPCCSQCANVGLECRASDKLSRRAFPRGYTESLEERVRHLETDVRELKDLLDEKDEKIDMLSKMYSNQRRTSTASRTASSPLALASEASPSTRTDISPHTSSTSSHESHVAKGVLSGASTKDVSAPIGVDGNNLGEEPESPAVGPLGEGFFRVQAPPLVLGAENSDSYFMGASSGRTFVDIFKRRVQENATLCPDFHPEAFFHIQGCYPLVEKGTSSNVCIPPRLFSDRCVNIYFQEWAPLFPILHRPTFLRIYNEFTSNTDKVKSHHKLAQLHLVFAIAGLCSEQPDLEQIAVCEQEWQRSLDAIIMDNTMITLQCLVLAILHCTMRADYKRLVYYKGAAIGLSQRLGLHQGQKRFSFGALTIETRKKVFWTLYTLDCFSAAVMGLPRQLKDDDIETETPADADDEYVTEKGFQTTLPRTTTRLSAALALFRVARILARVLDVNYPAIALHELSLQKMASLESDLLAWRDALPAHLSLTFRQEKPSTDVTGDRSPLLSLTFYYIRTLIWRPAIGSSLGAKAAPAVLAVGESSKHIVQIVELLEERKMSFAICMNKSDLLVVCGMTLLYQSMDLKRDSKMMKDTERLIAVVLNMAERLKAPGFYDLKRVAALLLSTAASPPAVSSGSLQLTSQSASSRRKGQPQRLLPIQQSSNARDMDLILQQDKFQQMSMSATMATAGSVTQKSNVSVRARSSIDISCDQSRLSQSQSYLLGVISSTQQQKKQKQKQKQQQQQRLQPQKGNVEYMARPSSPLQGCNSQQQELAQPFFKTAKQAESPTCTSHADWEALISLMDCGQLNVYDAIYGGRNIGLPYSTDAPTTASATSQSGDGWSPESWDLSAFNGAANGLNDIPAPTQSVMSFSSESRSSVTGDKSAVDLGSLDLDGLDIGNNVQYRTVSNGSAADSYLVDGLEGRYAM